MTRTRFVYCLVSLATCSVLLSAYVLLYGTGPAGVAEEAGRALDIAERNVGTPSRGHQLQDKLGRQIPISSSDNTRALHSHAGSKVNTTTTAVVNAPQVVGPHNLQVGLPASLREKFPHFMIVGFGKAGTRALYDVLRLHPQLAGPQKEERFFSLKYGKGLSKYLSSFPTRPAGGFLIEKSPDYLLEPRVPARIMAAARLAGRRIEDLTFIVITRNPIDRAMSEYLEWKIQRRLAGSPKLPPFEEMVFKDGVLHTQQPFINASCYEYHIGSWLRTFSQRQMCYVDGDAFVRSPLQQVQLLESCLGLQPFFSDRNFVFNERRGFYCFRTATETQQCMGGGKGRPHPQIAADVRTRLVDYFQQCNSHLAQHTGFEISY